MGKHLGRNLKYVGIIKQLEPNTIYSASTIAEFARFIGYVPFGAPDRQRLTRNIRSACGYMVAHFAFPISGDGQVTIKGQRPTPGWYGWRWQEVVRSREKEHRNSTLKRKRKRRGRPMKKEVEMIFQEDEMQVQRCQQRWTRKDFLEQEGLFHFKDVNHLLQIETPLLKEHYEQELSKGISPWLTIGVRKVWTQWLLRMKAFAPFYRRELEPIFLPVARHWDTDTLLSQKGVFRLSDVCKKISYTTSQVYRLAKKQNIGAWKDDKLHFWLVNMEVFALWIEQDHLAPTTKIR